MKFLPVLLLTTVAALAAGDSAKLPPPAAGPVDFVRDIQPLFEAACVKCHAKGKDKGGFSLETRESFLKGGDTAPGAEPGKSATSNVVELVAGLDPDEIMPKKGTRWTPAQVGLLRAWIDQGAVWPAGITFAKPPPENLQARPAPAVADQKHPVDSILASYAAQKQVAFSPVVEDRVFARRVYLDLVGLLPTPQQLDDFTNDPASDKRAKLVRRLLADREGYAGHWLTFWNDLLRNDYKGVGFIDGGRKQISGWLYRALLENKPYDRFVAELVNPEKPSEGFSRGIIWRGTVNASMLPPMQAAQNVSQVFLGVNLKCASCHDSFVNDWSLADAYGMAAIYADQKLELIHCDKPTGKTSAGRFLYPELGALDPAAPKAERLRRLAEIVTSPQNGRLSRTLVNRLWARLLGRGLVEPLDDMEKPAWSRDLIDWLAEDFVAHGYDVKHTLEVICTSRAYQSATVEAPDDKQEYVFRGPQTRRLTAEQFSDALGLMTGEWNRLPSSLEFDFSAGGQAGEVTMPQWIWTSEPVELGRQRSAIRAANSSIATATKTLVTAQQQLTLAAAQGGAALAQAQKAVDDATGALQTAQWYLHDATQPRVPEPAVLPESDRHRVIFRRSFDLAAVPTEAYGVILATQGWQVQVNGREAKPLQRDGFRNGRIAIFNLQSLLQVGENTIVLSVSSHTEKQLNDIERPKYPASLTHLNPQSAVAFYARLEMPEGGSRQIATDATWRVQRNPDGRWGAVDYADGQWALAVPLPAGAAPVDEGPSLEPIARQDFANLPAELGPQLQPVVSLLAKKRSFRAAFLAADPLQVALDRPNREIVIPSRPTVATTLQALELTNGATLNAKLQKVAPRLATVAQRDPVTWLRGTYRQALGREPYDRELSFAREMLGTPVSAEGVADVLWALVNLPEFQLIN